MIHITRRTRRGLADAIGIPSLIGVIILGTILLQQAIVAGA